MLERRTLQHAEAVLLIRHGKRKVMKHHGFFNERVRADRKLCRPVGKAFECRTLFRRLHAADKQHGFDAECRKQAA